MVPDKNRKFHRGQQFSTKFDFNYFSYLKPMLFTIAIRYVNSTGGLRITRNRLEFDVSTVPGILNTPDPNSEHCGVSRSQQQPNYGYSEWCAGRAHIPGSMKQKSRTETLQGQHPGRGLRGPTSFTLNARSIWLEDGTGRQKVIRPRPCSRRKDCPVGNTGYKRQMLFCKTRNNKTVAELLNKNKHKEN